MSYMRPFSILSSRIPQLFGWVVEPQTLAEPFLSQEELRNLHQKKVNLHVFFGSIASMTQNNPKGYTPPTYFPKLKG